MEVNNEELRVAMEDIFNYEKEFRTNVGKDINEMNFLKEQIT
jgi:predicted RNA-binding protein